MTLTQKKTSAISIIVPTLNEARNLPALRSLAEQVREVLVVDGGSRDETVSLARGMGFQVMECFGGRGAQLNMGAACATAPILLFLHADTLLPPDFADAVRECLDSSVPILGAFRLQVEGGGRLLKTIVRLANLRSELLKLPYGDQGLFLRRETFARLGGFPPLPIMEDYAFVKQAQRCAKVRILRQTVITSGRRWQHVGPIRTTLINQLVIFGFHLGVPPEKLALFYRRGLIFGKFSGDKGTHHLL